MARGSAIGSEIGVDDRPISARRAATRERLLTAAREVVAERGIGAAAVEDICEVAGFTRGAFYSNFASKEELFIALLRQETELLLGLLRQVLAEADPEPPSGDGHDGLDRLIDRFMSSQPRDRDWVLVHTEFWLYGLRNPSFGVLMADFHEGFKDRIGTLIDEGLAAVGRRLTVDPDDAITTLMGVFDQANRTALMNKAVGHEHPIGPQRMLPLILRAMSTEI